MATYLVDTENTGHEWFDIAMRCADGHRCLLFFTDYTAKLTFSEFARLAPIAANFSVTCGLHDYIGERRILSNIR